MGSNCKVIRAEIEESAGGAWLSRAAGEHLAACASCLGFKNERESLRRLVGGLERVEAPGDFEFRLRARMAAANEAQRARPSVFRLAPGLASFALAAVFVASVAAAYYFNRTTPTGPTADHAASRQTSTATETATQPTTITPSAATASPAVEVVNTKDKNTKDERADASPSMYDERAAVVRPSRQERRRASARAATEPRVEVVKAPTEGVLEFGLSTSPVVKGSNVKLEVTAEPLRVVLRDEHGTPRRLSMRPVSFGAQNPVGKRRELKTMTVADTEGVW